MREEKTVANSKIDELTSLKTELKRELGLWEGVSIIAGIMIGSGIFFLGSFVLQRSHLAPGLALLAWLAGGIITLLAGLCYAELGAAIPRAGGAYVYLREAYGPLMGFLSGWTSFFVSASGSISALAVAFATYFSAIVPLSPLGIKLLAIGTIIFLTFINALGVKLGGQVQNVLMIAKLLPIVIIIVAGLVFGSADNPMTVFPGGTGLLSSFGMALIASLWAYEGWSNVNTIAEEIKNPQRNLPLALLIAIGGVTTIYVLFNFALLKVLPAATIAADAKPAAAAAKLIFGPWGASLVTLGALISIFGSTNGCVLVFPRTYYAMAKDGLFFPLFAEVHPEYRTPIPSLIASAAVAIILLYTGTFQQLTTMVVFAGWVFYTLTIVSVFILRRKYPDLPRPYKVWGYPVVPALSVLTSLFLLINCLIEDPRSSLFGLVIPALGVPAYYWFKAAQARREARLTAAGTAAGRE
ncbi:MAG: basic amino acid/polyamine antiporter, family [Bacillota bacterium]|nr:basic amino acid/polyamine antiporter, family [Bacillota bacterium]MDK2925176.1 basic amino acid/polyamine antiporter, family [Bacillota bacterium]